MKFSRVLLLIAMGAALADDIPPQDPAIVRKKVSLLRELEKLEADKGVYSTSAIPHLMELSSIYLEQDNCPYALFMLNRAAQLTRINYGLFNADQMEMGELIKECDLRLTLPNDFEREQRYEILVSDTVYGRDDPRALPALKRVAAWYEEAGWYLSARQLYVRAADIVRKAGGEMDLRLVDPLRGIARTRRLALAQGLEPHDIAATAGPTQIEDLQWRRSVRVLDRLGEESLKHAVRILREQPPEKRAELIDTLIDLGDWYQVDETWRSALNTYKEALREADALGNTQPLFSQPAPVIYHMEDIGVTLHKPLEKSKGYHLYWMKFDFTVLRDGKMVAMKMIDSDAPDSYRQDITEALQRTRFRPRFVQGEPVDTPHVSFRQGLYVKQ